MQIKDVPPDTVEGHFFATNRASDIMIIYETHFSATPKDKPIVKFPLVGIT